jgi:regulatory protein
MAFPRKPAKPRSALDERGLYEYAVKALGRQMRSEAELRRLMSARAEAGERGEAAVRIAVARLKEHGYLRGCGRKMRSSARGACARICSRRESAQS